MKTTEQRYRRLLDYLPVGVFQTTLTGKVVEGNATFLQITGYASLEALNQAGGAPCLYVDKGDRARLLEALQKGQVTDFETRFRRANSKTIQVVISSYMSHEEGSEQFINGIIEDISSRKATQQATLESENRFRTIYEGSNDAIMLLTPKGFFDCNQRTLELFGFKAKEDFTKVHPGDISPPTQPDGTPSLEASQRHIQTAYQQGYDRFDWVHQRSNGEDFPAEVLLTAFDLGGEKVLQATVRDVTERRRLEQQIRQSLARREKQVEISAEIAQSISSVLSIDELFALIVQQFKERFGYYHVQIFRYDPILKAVKLIAGYGKAGEQMLATDYNIKRGQGVVGKVAATGKPSLASDVRIDSSWVSHPLLPDTKCELAIPIKWRDQVLGILNVQSDQPGALTTDDQLVLEGLCSQIATVIQSNQLLIEANVFRQLAAASGQGIAMTTLDGKLTYLNPELCRMIGVTRPDSLLGQPFMDHRPENLVQKIHHEILPVVMEKGQWAGEMAIKIQSGRVIITQENFLLLRDERQNPYLMAFVVTDITARKHNDAEMQESIKEIERLNQMMSREAWQTFRETTKLPPGYLFDQLSLQTAENLWSPEIIQATQQRKLVHSNTDNSAAVAPLAVRGEVVGALGVYDDPQHPLSPDELAVIEDVAAQVALALENARLFEDIQRRAGRERLIGDVTARVRESLDMDTILQIAVREMQAALKLSEVEVQITGKESLAR